MERLTERERNVDGTGIAKEEITDGLLKPFADKILTKLADYENLEEQGLLVRLPCKVGEEVLKELSYGDTAYGGNRTYEVRMEAIKALKKQIPMKPNNVKTIFDFSGKYYTTKGNCPVCNREGLYKSDFYCNKCGQKLDWSEEGEINETEKGNAD